MVEELLEQELDAELDRCQAPKPRKHSRAWQAYLWWREVMEMRKRHQLRLKSIERGNSNLDAALERNIMQRMELDRLLEDARSNMITICEEEFGDVWRWVTSIPGLGAGGLAAQLLAQIDDISAFPNVSKLWRFSGWGVVDGRAETNMPGEKSHYNRVLKATCHLIAEQFLRQQTPVYVDMYYEEKARQRELHPQVMCRTCGCPWEECKSKSVHKRMYNDGHLHHRARRRMIKIFLAHLWEVWRVAEGLPVTPPYAQSALGHTIYPVPYVTATAAR